MTCKSCIVKYRQIYYLENKAGSTMSLKRNQGSFIYSSVEICLEKLWQEILEKGDPDAPPSTNSKFAGNNSRVSAPTDIEVR